MGAAMMWLNATPKGRELRAKIMAHLDPLYKELKESLSKLEGPTKEMYYALVERAVAEYAAKKELAEEISNALIRKLKARWSELERELKK